MDADSARDRAQTALLVAFALGVAWAMKDFHRRAGFDELRWLLAPTVRLVELTTGVPFELEPHQGYLSRALRYDVVPACAGVNFVITAFLSLCLGLAPVCRSLRARAGLVVASAAAAYAVTVLANATRLSIAMRLHENGAAFGWLTPGRLHCAVGVAVYFVYLGALFALATRAFGGGRALVS